MNAVDTNVLIYVNDSRAPGKQAIAASLVRDLRFDNVPFMACLILLQSDCLAGILFLRRSLKYVNPNRF
jgi:hypothetical protein